jgi:flagellar protein FliO/FliZ
LPHDTPARHGRHHPRRRTRPSRPLAAAAIAAAAWAATLGVPAWASAAGTSTAAGPESQALPPSGGDTPGVAEGMGGSLGRLFIGLVVVVVLILAVWWLMRRLNRSRMPGTPGGPAADLVEVVSTTPLGPNRYLHLVRVGQELILVGATDHAVSAVARIGAEDLLDGIDPSMPPDITRETFTRPGTSTDARARAAATAHDATVLDRLRAMTARR